MPDSNFLKYILDSKYFKNAYQKASANAKNNKAINAILGTISSKLNSGKSIGFAKIIGKVKSLGRLLKYYANGSYKNIEMKSIVLVLASLIYFISPIDIIPDFLPILGYTDDIALLTFVFNSLSDEIEKFDLWLMNKDAGSFEEEIN